MSCLGRGERAEEPPAVAHHAWQITSVGAEAFYIAFLPLVMELAYGLCTFPLARWLQRTL